MVSDCEFLRSFVNIVDHFRACSCCTSLILHHFLSLLLAFYVRLVTVLLPFLRYFQIVSRRTFVLTRKRADFCYAFFNFSLEPVTRHNESKQFDL